MYHYVRERDGRFPHFRYLEFDNFRRQLDYFDRSFGFVNREEWDAFCIDGVEPADTGKVVLTFDDAMQDHFSYVFDELVTRGIWGIFYVPTGPYQHRVMLDVHRIHLLCGAVDGSQLYDCTNSIVDQDMISDAKREEFQREPYARQNNYVGVSEVKKILNYFIDCKYQKLVVDKLCEVFSINASVEKFYISERNISEMENNGMIIGAHTVNHPVMSKLSASDQASEIFESFRYLENICEMKQKTYCHPYGGHHSFDDKTIDILNDNNVDYSFSVESRQIRVSDRENQRHYLPRFDCNQFPYGKAS